jgi:ribonuclease P protein component
MAGQFLRAAGSVAVGSLPSATNGSSATPKPSLNTPQLKGGSSDSRAFPKSSRILKSRDFRKVYDEGTRMTSPSFAAFLLRTPKEHAGNGDRRELVSDQASGPRRPLPASEPPEPGGGPLFGFTTPRAIGKAVVRNRVRRRMREAVRLEQHLFAPGWSIVFNPRRTLADIPFEALRKEVAKVAARCKP